MTPDTPLEDDEQYSCIWRLVLVFLDTLSIFERIEIMGASRLPPTPRSWESDGNYIDVGYLTLVLGCKMIHECYQGS